MKITKTIFTTDSNKEHQFLKARHLSENPSVELISLSADDARPDGKADYTYYEIDKKTDSN